MRHIPTIFLFALSGLAQTLPSAPPPSDNPASVSGTVTNTVSGQPVASVMVGAADPEGRVAQDTTGPNGHFTLKGLGAGEVQLTLYPPTRGIRPRMRWVSLSPGQRLESVNLSLTPSVSISGRVTDEEKHRVPGLTVLLVAREYAFGALRYTYAGSASTNDKGEYELLSAEPGHSYVIMAKPSESQLNLQAPEPADPRKREPEIAPAFFPGTDALETAQLVAVEAGRNLTNLDIKVKRQPPVCASGSIAGKGLGSQFRFQLNELSPASGMLGSGFGYFAQKRGAVIEPGKTFRICGLHRGEYELTANTNIGDVPRLPEGFVNLHFVVRNEDLEHLTVVPEAKIRVPVEFIWNTAGPHPDRKVPAEIDLLPLRRSWYAHETDLSGDEGEASLAFSNLFGEDYSIKVRNLDPGSYVKDIVYGGASIKYAAFHPSRGADWLRVVLGSDGGNISASVADKDGKPEADVNVIVLPSSAASDEILAASIVTGRTSPNGLWTSPTLEPGKYYLYTQVADFDRSPETVRAAAAMRTSAAEVEVSPGNAASVRLVRAGVN